MECPLRLNRLEVFNFCQHRNRDITFGDGLTAFIGQNGSGKSNLLGAIRFALTGDNPNAGTKDANICQLADPTERSFVRLHFAHAGVSAVVQRNLRPDTPSTLDIVGEAQIRGDKRVNPRILEILGINKDTLNDIVIVAQDQLFGFLAKLPGERAKAFQRLFHTEAASTLHQLLTKEIASTIVPAVVNLDEIRQRHTAAMQELERLQVQKGAYGTIEAVTTAITSENLIVQQWEQRVGYLRQIAVIQGEIARLSGERDVAGKAVQEQSGNVETLQAALDGSKAAADEARGLLATLRHQAQVAAARQQLQLQQQNARARLGALIQPVKTATLAETEANREALTQQLQQLGTAQQIDQTFVNSFDPKTGRTQCPTCFTPVVSLADALIVAREQLPQRAQQIAGIQQRLNEYAAYTKAVSDHGQTTAFVERELAGYTNQLAALEQVAPVTRSEQELSQVIATHDEYAKAITTYQTSLSAVQQQLSRIDGALEVQQRQLQQYETAAATITTTESQANTARGRVTMLTRELEIHQQLSRDLAVANSRVSELQQSLTQMEAAEAQAAKTRSWISRVQAMRDVVHPDAAPRFVAQRNLRRLEATINEHLTQFGTDYRVRADEGLSFTAMFTDVRQQPAERLSGGQKVVLALAFRLAVNFTAAADLGFLVLDEPTAYLDEHHIRGFVPVLGKLRELAASRGLQCLIITHERELAPLFDSVVAL